MATTYTNWQANRQRQPSGNLTNGAWNTQQGTVGTTGPLPQGFSGTQGTAYTREVQDNELVSNQLTGLLARDSPYIRQAEMGAQRQAASRGIQDSSIDQGAARAAAIQAGLPIAQADAAAYGTAAGQNIDALNAMALQQQGDATSRYNAGLSAGASRYSTDMGLAGQRERLAYEGEQAGLDRTFNDYQSQQTRQFQDYMARQGFSESQIAAATQQMYGQQNTALGAGLGLLAQGQNFRYNAALAAMENPYIMGNQQAFGGFMNWVQGDAPAYMSNLFNFAFGLGGNP